MTSHHNKNWASVRIRSRVLTATNIACRVGESPDVQFERGTLMSPANPYSAVREESICVFRSSLLPSVPLAEHVSHLLSRFSLVRPQLMLLRADCEIDLYCGVDVCSEQASVVLSASDIHLIADLGLSFEICLYREGITSGSHG